MSNVVRTRFVLGSGRSSGVRFIQFSRSARSPYEKLKARYGVEMERLSLHLGEGICITELSPEKRQELRRQVARNMRRQQMRNWLAVGLTGLILVSLFGLASIWL
jgi:hypothetical protein